MSYILVILCFTFLFCCGEKEGINTKGSYLCELCEETNTVVEDIMNVPGRIVHVKSEDWNLDFWYISISEDSLISTLDKKSSLVPCNESFVYPEGAKVLVSGKRSDCCGDMLTPYSAASYMILGCKFKIDKIQRL